MMIYLDVTRLLTRLKVTSPSGMDRVEFEYAQYGLRSGWGFVGQEADHIAQMPTWLLEQVVERLRQRWEHGADEDPVLATTVQRWQKTIRPRRVGSDTEAFFRNIRSKSFLSRLPIVYGARADISKRAPLIPVHVSVLAVASLPGLFSYLFTPKQPPETATFRVYPTFRNNIYLNVGHAGLEKCELMQMLKKRGDVKLAIYVHDLLPMTHPHLFPDKDVGKHVKRLENIKLCANAILVNSNFTRQQFEERFGAGSVCSVLEIGSPAISTRKLNSCKRHGFVSIGTIEPRKNYFWLVNAWLEFAKRNANLVQGERLTIFGKAGWLLEQGRQELYSLVESSDSVQIVSGASDEIVRERLLSARAYLTAAEVEGWGMPLAEALGSGTPVIATDIPAHREVTQGRAKFFPYGSDLSLHELLLACFDTDAYHEMVSDISAYQPWNWSSHFGRLQTVLQSIEISGAALKGYGVNCPDFLGGSNS